MPNAGRPRIVATAYDDDGRKLAEVRRRVDLASYDDDHVRNLYRRILTLRAGLAALDNGGVPAEILVSGKRHP